MSAVRDNWERIVRATLRREQLRHLSRLDSMSTTASGDSFRLAESSLDLRKLGYSFRYRMILQATKSFSEELLIHRGSSGDLFRAITVGTSSFFPRKNNWNNLIVKRIDLKSANNREAYLRELNVLSKVWNSQLKYFAFVGHCLEREDEKLLVYKYTSNGDLSNSLFKKNHTEKDGLRSLDWITRLKIATGTAAALAYLHHDCSPSLVHGDVQASSILLDGSFEVRLGSVGHSYAQQSDDDWIFRGTQSYHSGMECAEDVYCFGKVLLELVTGKLGISAPNNAVTNDVLEEDFLRHISRNNVELLIPIVDPSLLVGEDLLQEVWSMSIVCKYCLDPEPQKRPLMDHVLKALENPVEMIRAAQTVSHEESWPDALLQHLAAFQ